MNPVLIATLLAQYGPSVIPLVQKLIADIAAGRTASTVTAADLDELSRLSGLTAAGLYATAGVTAPPAAK